MMSSRRYSCRLHMFLTTVILELMAFSREGAAQDPVNLVVNPGFEQATSTDEAVDWTSGALEFQTNVAKVDKLVSRAGQSSLRLGVRKDAFARCLSAEHIGAELYKRY